MRKTPPFYVLFVIVNDQEPKGGNCFCAAGASQSCIHISALLFTEITPQACTSVRCAWSRPSVSGSTSLANFGHASLVSILWTEARFVLALEAAGSKNGVIDYFKGEEERDAMSNDPVSQKKKQFSKTQWISLMILLHCKTQQ